jgi:hypothetical protein
MPRSVSSALATAIAQKITSVGYLIEIGTTVTRRWSNIGQVSWNSLTWQNVSFALEGLAFDADASLAANLTIQNLAGIAGESPSTTKAADIFLSSTEHMYDILVTVYQFERSALAAIDVPKIAILAINDCEIGVDKVKVSLVENKSDAAFSPRRRISPTDGFYFATPAGTVLQWENEILTVEPSDG